MTIETIDPIESIALIPNSSQNFDEIWVVVNRANGRFIERMTQRLYAVDCGDELNVLLDDQVFMDSTLSYDEGDIIQSITATEGVEYTVTVLNHGYSNGQIVRLRNLSGSGALTLNNTSWVIGSVTTDTFKLVTQV